MDILPEDGPAHKADGRSESLSRSSTSSLFRQPSRSTCDDMEVLTAVEAWEAVLDTEEARFPLQLCTGAAGSGDACGSTHSGFGSNILHTNGSSVDAVSLNATADAACGSTSRGQTQQFTASMHGAIANCSSKSFSSSSSPSLSRETSGSSSSSGGLSELLATWEAELDATEAKRISTGAPLSAAAGSGGAYINGSPTSQAAATAAGPSNRDPAQFGAALADTPLRRQTAESSTVVFGRGRGGNHPSRRPLTAEGGRGGGAGGGYVRGSYAAAAASGSANAAANAISKRKEPNATRGLSGGSSQAGPIGGCCSGGAGAGNVGQRRRAAFVAGSVSVSQRKPGAQTSSSSNSSSIPARDILLPRLPAPALDLIVPALPPATRAALRCTCKDLRLLVDNHTHSLTLRPDCQVAGDLCRRGSKVFELFPALRHATVILSGSCSGAAGPTIPAGQGPAGTHSATATATARRPGSASSSSLSLGSKAKAAAAAPTVAAAASPLLTLSSWLINCGVGRCLTSLTMHLYEITLVEELALNATHPHLQRLELFIGRSGSSCSSPMIQFMIGVLTGLRHFSMTWAGPGTCLKGSGPQAERVPSLASLTHGSRRLFLDGRPRLGPLLLATLTDLTHLESLELRGLLLDTEGSAVLARHWPRLSTRLKRLVLSNLHVMVHRSTPPDQQLGELIGSCTQLRELHADLYLPISASMPVGAAGVGPAAAAAAAALLISRTYAGHDVWEMRPELMPTSLTRLSLPGVRLTEPLELAALSRLANLTSLELTALGPRAGEYLPALQELRLVNCYWRQLLDMLPWKQQERQQRLPAMAAAASIAAAPPPPLHAAPALAWQGREQQPHQHQHADQAAGSRRLGLVRGGAAAGGAVAVDAEEGVGEGPAAAAAAALDTPVVPTAAAAAAGSVHSAGVGPRAEVAEIESPVLRTGSGGGGGAAPVCGQLRVLEVVVCERLDDWEAPDRGLLARVGKGLLPLVDGGCRVRLKVAPDAQPNIWNESDEDGKPWEPMAVWRHIKAAQNIRRLQAETRALTERLARGRLLQAARKKEKEMHFIKR